MDVIITSKNNSKTFSDTNVINIGTAPNCNYKLDLPFDVVISLQKHENGKWRVINTSKSDKVLFKGQAIGFGIEITSMCKLMFSEADEFLSIKIVSIEVQNKINTQNENKIKPKEPAVKKNAAENNNEYELFQKTNLDRIKSEIEKRRSMISKDISYKCNELRAKLSQNETILSVLNLFIFIIPLVMAYILNDIIRIETDTAKIAMSSKITFLIAVAFIVITSLLKQSQYLTLRTNGKRNVNASTIRVKSMCSIVSIGSFATIILFAITELITHNYQMSDIVPIMVLFCSFLCIFIGIFSGFTKNIIAESGEELDGYESREDYISVINDYQEWINHYVNSISRKKLKHISNKIFTQQLWCAVEYIAGILTAPVLAYGVSQTLAGYFPEAAGFISITQAFRISPVFLTLATLMIIFAFHCFTVSFYTNKRVFASNIIKQDGFNDYNVHGVTIHGIESTKNLQKEAKKYFLIAICVVFVEVIMNMSYFIKDADDMQSIVLALLAALIPTILLIIETNMAASTKFKISIQEELLDKTDKEY